jgi:hypothetical protein
MIRTTPATNYGGGDGDDDTDGSGIDDGGKALYSWTVVYCLRRHDTLVFTWVRCTVSVDIEW